MDLYRYVSTSAKKSSLLPALKNRIKKPPAPIKRPQSLQKTLTVIVDKEMGSSDGEEEEVPMTDRVEPDFESYLWRSVWRVYKDLCDLQESLKDENVFADRAFPYGMTSEFFVNARKIEDVQSLVMEMEIARKFNDVMSLSHLLIRMNLKMESMFVYKAEYGEQLGNFHAHCVERMAPIREMWKSVSTLFGYLPVVRKNKHVMPLRPSEIKAQLIVPLRSLSLAEKTAITNVFAQLQAIGGLEMEDSQRIVHPFLSLVLASQRKDYDAEWYWMKYIMHMPHRACFSLRTLIPALTEESSKVQVARIQLLLAEYEELATLHSWLFF